MVRSSRTKGAPWVKVVLRTYRLRYQLARPSLSSTPCTMPSPVNQCPAAPRGLGPLRTYMPWSDGGMWPRTVSSVRVVSSATGA